MTRSQLRPLALFACLALGISSAYAEETIPDEPVTFWPFIDIRTSADGEKTISLLGPIIDLTNSKDAREVSIRPLYHERRLLSDGSSRADIVYPIAAQVKDSESTSFTVLKGLYEKSTRTEEQGKNTRGTMLFPFYISGTSEKYGPYVSIFPIYGDIYERFWRDEYHYVMFPLYSRTVKKGTVSTNYLYPFFSVISGENESGFQFWPLYGIAEKVGVYKKRFAVWPVYSSEESGLDTDNPTLRQMLFPLYAAQDSPKGKSRHYLWPFFGYAQQANPPSRENYFLWPFWWTVAGEKRNAEYFLPLYASDRRENSSKTWVLWPGYRHDVINSDRFVQEKTSLLVFLYRDNKEAWPKDDVSRRKSGLWPVYSYARSEKGVSKLSFPALLENLVDSEGVDENWAPLWRIYRQEWRTDGAASFSFLWNLVWYEQRDSRSSHEVFPLWRYSSRDGRGDFSILKGLFRYHSNDSEASVGLLWIPRVVRWERNAKPAAEVSK